MSAAACGGLGSGADAGRMPARCCGDRTCTLSSITSSPPRASAFNTTICSPAVYWLDHSAALRPSQTPSTYCCVARVPSLTVHPSCVCELDSLGSRRVNGTWARTCSGVQELVQRAIFSPALQRTATSATRLLGLPDQLLHPDAVQSSLFQRRLVRGRRPCKHAPLACGPQAGRRRRRLKGRGTVLAGT